MAPRRGDVKMVVVVAVVLLLVVVGAAGGAPRGVTGDVPEGSLRGHFSLREVEAWMNATMGENAEVMGVATLGASLEGRPIHAWCVGTACVSSPTTAPETLFTALHHAREPLSMTALVYFLDDLFTGVKAGDKTKKHLLRTRRMDFVMVVNPDGYVANEQGEGMKRKNARGTCPAVRRNREAGIDLNRNYDFCFNVDREGSSPDPCEIDYGGDKPFSEPETVAIRDFVLSRSFRVAFNYHSFGRYVYYPNSCRSKGLTKDEPYFRAFAARITKENGFKYGQPWATNLYTVNGDAADWMYATKGIFAFSPEVAPADPVPSEHEGFWISQKDLIPGWSKENNAMNYHAVWNSGSCVEVRSASLVSAREAHVVVANEGLGAMEGHVRFASALFVSQEKEEEEAESRSECTVSAPNPMPALGVRGHTPITLKVSCSVDFTSSSQATAPTTVLRVAVTDAETCVVFSFAGVAGRSSGSLELPSFSTTPRVAPTDDECVAVFGSVVGGEEDAVDEEAATVAPATAAAETTAAPTPSPMTANRRALGLGLFVASILLVLLVVWGRRWWARRAHVIEHGDVAFSQVPAQAPPV